MAICQQPERFALMEYRCGLCGAFERIWNSRNAVTPFCVDCATPNCSGLKQHVNWTHDARIYHLPDVADRVFISVTHELAAEIARKKLDRFIAKGHDPVGDRPRELVLKEWAEHIYGDGNQPHVITRAEYLSTTQQKDPS